MSSMHGIEPDALVDVEAAMEGLDEVADTSDRDTGSFDPQVFDKTLSVGMPSEPLFGVLPLARIIPQDIHSAMDYLNAAAIASAWASSSTIAGKATSCAAGSSVLMLSLFTDYRLSLAKVIPVEAHQAIETVAGAALIAAPFALGYWKKDRITSIVHMAMGAATILMSLFTDYRSVKRA